MEEAPVSEPSSHSVPNLQQLIDSIEIDGIYMLDVAGRVLTWNRGAELNKGYEKDEIIGRHYSIFFTPEDAAQGLPESSLLEAERLGRKAGEGWRLRKNGERFWVSFVLTAMRDPSGTLIGFSKVIRDLTERKRHEDALRNMETALRLERDRLRAAAESSLDALFLCESLRAPDGSIEDFSLTFANSNARKLVSTPGSELIGARLGEILTLNCNPGFLDNYKSVVESRRPYVREYPLPDDPVNHDRWLRVQAVPLADGLAITLSDITERKRYELQIAYIAQHDSLTGLPNRNLLDDRIQQALERASRLQSMVGFLMLDLDGFKSVNDTFGHAAGDQLLRTVAHRFSACLRATDTLVRIGGDEFLLIVPDVRRLHELVVVVDKLVACLLEPIPIDNRMVTQTTSIGIAVFPDSHLDPTELIKRADIAMYNAKNDGKNKYRFYERRTRDTSSR